MGELDRVGELVYLKALLASGRALQLVSETPGLTEEGVGRQVGLSQASVSRCLHGLQFPRRSAARKLLALLDQLEVVSRER